MIVTVRTEFTVALLRCGTTFHWLTRVRAFLREKQDAAEGAVRGMVQMSGLLLIVGFAAASWDPVKQTAGRSRRRTPAPTSVPSHRSPTRASSALSVAKSGTAPALQVPGSVAVLATLLVHQRMIDGAICPSRPPERGPATTAQPGQHVKVQRRGMAMAVIARHAPQPKAAYK